MRRQRFSREFKLEAVKQVPDRGDREPHGPALVLLNLIDREPKTVKRAL